MEPFNVKIRSPEADNRTSTLIYIEEIGKRIKKRKKDPKSKNNVGTEQEDGWITTMYGRSTENSENRASKRGYIRGDVGYQKKYNRKSTRLHWKSSQI